MCSGELLGAALGLQRPCKLIAARSICRDDTGPYGAEFQRYCSGSSTIFVLGIVRRVNGVQQSRSALNAFASFAYRDPVAVLRELRRIELQIVDADLSPQVRNLRTNDLKSVREFRHAALFCHGMSSRIGHKVLFSPVESSDYDFVATWQVADVRHFAPVQIKELVPAHLNVSATVQALVDGLSKYSGDSWVVAIFLNREGRFSLEDLRLPALRIAELWFVFSTTPNQQIWQLVGDALSAPEASSFSYPA